MRAILRVRNKGVYVVTRNFFLLLLNCSARPCLGPAQQNKQTFIFPSVQSSVPSKCTCRCRYIFGATSTLEKQAGRRFYHTQFVQASGTSALNFVQICSWWRFREDNSIPAAVDSSIIHSYYNPRKGLYIDKDEFNLTLSIHPQLQESKRQFNQKEEQ